MRTYVRHALSMLAGVAMLCALTLVGAAPAQAVVGVDLTASKTTLALGESFNMSWTSTDAIDLIASGAWTGSKGTPSGADTVTPGSVGTLNYTLTATDANGREAADTVTVTVTAAPSTPITPAPVTFDGCEVNVPGTPNVQYLVDFGDGDTEKLEEGTYPADAFGSEPVVFIAEANDGFELDEEAVTEWEYTAPDNCGLVTVTATCDSVTFTNVSEFGVNVQWGSFDESQADGEFDLDQGAVHTIQTDRDHVDFVASAGGEGEDGQQEGGIDLPTCDVDPPADGSDHPTVAPAAGASS